MTADSRNCWLAAAVVVFYWASVVSVEWWMWRDAVAHIK